jgi:hypothetical protein
VVWFLQKEFPLYVRQIGGSNICIAGLIIYTGFLLMISTCYGLTSHHPGKIFVPGNWRICNILILLENFIQQSGTGHAI